MRNVAIAFFAVAALALPAGAPGGFELWTGAQLKGYAKSLAPEMSPQKVASTTLGTWGNHLMMVAHREGNGEAEFHQTQADVFIVQSGEATIKIGGTVVDPKTTAPNEIRGPSINGGEERKLGPGDMLHIPAKVAHQMMVASGKQITYAVVKVTE